MPEGILEQKITELGDFIMMARLTNDMRHLTSEEVEDAKVLFVLMRSNKDVVKMIREVRERKEELDDEPEEAETMEQIAQKEAELADLRATLTEIRIKLEQDEDTL